MWFLCGIWCFSYRWICRLLQLLLSETKLRSMHLWSHTETALCPILNLQPVMTRWELAQIIVLCPEYLPSLMTECHTSDLFTYYSICSVGSCGCSTLTQFQVCKRNVRNQINTIREGLYTSVSSCQSAEYIFCCLTLSQLASCLLL